MGGELTVVAAGVSSEVDGVDGSIARVVVSTSRVVAGLLGVTSLSADIAPMSAMMASIAAASPPKPIITPVAVLKNCAIFSGKLHLRVQSYRGTEPTGHPVYVAEIVRLERTAACIMHASSLWFSSAWDSFVLLSDMSRPPSLTLRRWLSCP